MTPAALLALAQRLLCACRDPVTGEPLYPGVSVDACVEDVEAAARYLRQCAEAEPVATVRVHDTGGNAGIAWSGVPTENAGVMRGGTPLYPHPQPPSAQAGVPDGWKLVPEFPTEAMVVVGAGAINDNGGNARWSDIREAWAEMLAAATLAETCTHPQPPSAQPTLTAEIVERRLRTWRQRFVNRSGDQLALDDFLDRESLDDLVDFVCVDQAAERIQRQRKDPEAEIAFLRRVADARQQIIDGMIAERCAKQDAEMPRPLADWHEDDGAVVWWRFLVDEPAWIGTPLDDDWPGYHTHWTPHPKLPERER